MMTRRIFIDTGAFLALEDESDKHHDDAIRFRDRDLLVRDYRLITTSYVLDETLTLVRRRLGIYPSIDLSKKMRRSQIVKVVYISKEAEEKALDLFEKYDDKSFSFTDCVSFVIMKELSIEEAFTFDDHFSQMGFVKRP